MQPVTMLALASLPVAILVDSTLRRGRPSVGWVLGTSALYVLAFSQAIRILPPGTECDPIETASWLGTLAGLWVTLFLLYRGHTPGKPLPSPQQPLQPLQPSRVVFVREEQRSGMGGVAVYRLYQAPDVASARVFLARNPVTETLLHLVVETPQGNYCRDIRGMYKEAGSGPAEGAARAQPAAVVLDQPAARQAPAASAPEITDEPACIHCGKPAPAAESIEVQSKTWCASCAFARLQAGDRLDSRHLPFLVIMLLILPVVLLVRLVVGRLVGEQEGTPVNPGLWGAMSAFVCVPLYALLERTPLSGKRWIPAQEVDAGQRLDAGRALAAVEQAAQQNRSQEEISRLSELGPLTKPELDVLLKHYGRLASSQSDAGPGAELSPAGLPASAGPAPPAQLLTYAPPQAGSKPLSQAPARQETSTQAIVSLIMGIACWLILPLVGAVVAVITGHMARRQIRSGGRRLGGAGMATAGLVLGTVQLVLAPIVLSLGACLFYCPAGLGAAQPTPAPPSAICTASGEEAAAAAPLATATQPAAAVASMPAEAGWLQFSQTACGGIDQPGEVDTFAFSADTGDMVLIGISQVSGRLWAEIRLLDPCGDLLNTVSNPRRAEMTVRVTAGGTHTIQVADGYDGTLTGGYNLYLQKLNPPAGAAGIDLFQTLQGDIAEPAEMDAFVFSAHANDRVRVTMKSLSGGLWPGIRLYDPCGMLLSEHGEPGQAQITQVLPDTGSYTILAGDGFLGMLTGGYEISLEQLP